MICPQCFKKIEDDAAFCPHCNAYVGASDQPSHDDFVFCEGCGARLSAHDRTCPKCGRPAPGILSTESSSSDLAAGKTANFPRLTQQMIDADAAASREQAPTAAQVLSDSIDPSSTNVLRADELRAASVPPLSDGEDLYHKKKNRFLKPAFTVLVLAALLGGGYYFVTYDPFGVMPGFIAAFEQAASEMYPSRQLPQDPSADTEPIPEGPAEPTDADVFQVVSSSYNKVVDSFDALGDIIDDYNYGYIASDRSVREEKSAVAYATRDMLDAVVEDLDSLELPEDTQYAQDVENVKQLAGWVRTRVDIYCSSWDISLSFDGTTDLPVKHQDEILAPLRERATEDSEARDAYFAHVESYCPVEKSSSVPNS